MHTEDWTFDTHRIRLYIEGEGPTLLLIHGIGPGTSIPANFASVIPALAKHFRVVGMDLIGFGGSSRKTEAPFFDFELWCRQAAFVAEKLGADLSRVWGQSLGGAIALRLAADNPAITRVLTTGAGGGNHRLNAALDRFWTVPDSPDALRTAMLGSMFDTSGITDALVNERYETLQQGGIGEYFSAMMAGDKQALLNSVTLSADALAKVQAQVLVIHGREDTPVPWEDNALPVMRHLSHCDMVILGRCGHNPAREYPEKTLALALGHFAD